MPEVFGNARGLQHTTRKASTERFPEKVSVPPRSGILFWESSPEKLSMETFQEPFPNYKLSINYIINLFIDLTNLINYFVGEPSIATPKP